MEKPAQDRLNDLADKWLKNTITPEERIMLDQWYEADPGEPLLWTGEDESETELSARLQEDFRKLQKTNRRKHTKTWSIAAAAMLVLSLSIAWYFITQNNHKLNAVATKNNILPGANTAVLTLANGKKINLDSIANEGLIEEAGLKITKTSDGRLLYTSSHPDNGNSGSLWNTIETPRGGQYEIHLPDGTKVWLNAASKLVYPVSFKNVKERSIQLYGEAYFEVEKMKSGLPFTVHTHQQKITVLGTHFNVNCYEEEAEVKTTLLEGIVQVNVGDQPNDKVILKPGEQSISSAGRLRVNKVKAVDYIDWKDGYFKFDNESLVSIMRRVSRWYNVSVRYEEETLKQQRFSGTVSRFKNIAELLEKLELTGPVRFSITGKQITVIPD